MPPESFYLQCPSNASMHIYPKNTLAQYTINLQTPLVLGENYEVGLCEIQYPHSWDNVRRGHNTFDISFQSPRRAGKWMTMEKEIPAGYYATIPELLKAILRVYPSTNKKTMTLTGLEMKFNKTTRRVKISTNNMHLEMRRSDGQVGTRKTKAAAIIFKGDIARLLGFADKTRVEMGKKIISEFPATVSGGFHQFYVYTDAIEPQPHPDGNVSVLRTIPVEGKPNQEYLSKRFQKVYYMPLSKHSLSNISFKILDDTGHPVGFDYGKLLVVLHFQKKKLAAEGYK